MPTTTAPTPSDARFSRPDPALAPGTAHEGFTVVSAEPLPEISGTAYRLVHDASGARLLWLACADTNRSFSIAFKTPPANDKGTFHILEHSVLCGSDRFPVKEPFVTLLKTSMQTFLNALTFSDKTMYPVASTNVRDLENLMDVYLDAVLHPAIYRRPRIFEQEGWHLEWDREKDALSYNGVVYNEMRGALSDPDDVLYHAVAARLLPDTCYRFESGGTPAAIPTLSYEEFLDTHARHYNLANSYTILYGDLDIDRELAFVGERFAGATERAAGAPNPLGHQAPVMPEPSTVEMATAPENACVGLAYALPAATRESYLATEVLLDALLGSNEAPLKRRILAEGLGDDVSSFVDDIAQPFVLLELKGARPGAAGRFQELVEQACAELARGGIPRGRLEASLSQLEFQLREGDTGDAADGVGYSVQAMAGWLYDDDNPVGALRYEGELAAMKAGLAAEPPEGAPGVGDGYFERLLAALVCESRHRCRVELVPVERDDLAEQADGLAALRSSMDDEGLAAVEREVEALHAEQMAPDTPEALATLPRLALSEVGDGVPEPPAPRVAAPLPCVAHELDTHGIDYVYHYFDLRRLAADELPLATMLAELLGSLGTARHTAEQLDTLVERSLGALSFFCEVHQDPRDPDYVLPVLVVGASALADHVADLATLPQEVWAETDFSDTERMHDVLVQQRVALEQRFVGAGHAAALSRAAMPFSKAAVVGDLLSGVGYYDALRDLLDHWDERKDALAASLSALARRVFTADEVLVSFTGPAADRERFWELGGTLGLAERPDAAAHRLAVTTPAGTDEAFVIPANVAFVAACAPRSAADACPQGAWQVVTRVLSFDYLWNEVRVKGGAYGCGFRRVASGLRSLYSFRDPRVDETVARFDGAAGWLAAWQPDEGELDGYVVATVAAHDTPVKPRALARRQDGALLARREPGWRERLRAEELGCTLDDVRAAAAGLADFARERHLCVFGSRELVGAARTPLAVRDLMGGADDGGGTAGVGGAVGA